MERPHFSWGEALSRGNGWDPQRADRLREGLVRFSGHLDTGPQGALFRRADGAAKGLTSLPLPVLREGVGPTIAVVW